MTVTVVALIVAGVLIGLIVPDILRHNRRRDRQFVASYGGTAGVWIIQDPEQVDAYRLAPIPREEQSERWNDWTAYTAVNGPILLSPAQRTQVSKVLGTPDNLDYDARVGCRPSYEIRFRFARGDESLDVLVCLTCHLILIFRDGAFVGGGLLWSSPAEKVLHLCAELWADDSDIQKLMAMEPGR
jgi:hypothetical protein